MRSSRLGKSSNCGGQSVLTSAASQTFVVLFRWIAFPPQSWRRLVAWHVVSKAPIFHIQCRQSIFGVAPYPPPPHLPFQHGVPLKTHSGGLGGLFLDVSVVCISLDRTIPTPGQVSDNSNTSMESARTDTSPPPPSRGREPGSGLTLHQALLIHPSHGSSQHCRALMTRIPLTSGGITACQECY